MKKWLLLSVFLFSFSAPAQNISPYFSELTGMEDYNSNTNLLYRIYSQSVDSFYYITNHNIYLYNVINQADSIFQSDGSTYYIKMDYGYGRGVNDYKFWNNDPHKYIVGGVNGGFEPYPYLYRFDIGYIDLNWFQGEVDYLEISHKSDSLVYLSFNHEILFKSTSGGRIWDTVGNFNAVALSPFNDKILFGSGQYGLYKTINGGITQFLVDSTSQWGESQKQKLFFDKDSNYIFRTTYIYPSYYLKVSNNSGNAGSWQVKFSYPGPIYLTIDNSVSGSIYLAAGKNIYYSTDYGNDFSLFKSFDHKLIGIYKKPNSSILYTATFNTIFECNGSSIIPIKHISADPQIFAFEPLEIGNKWVYQGNLSYVFAPGIYHNFILEKEITKDTLLANSKTFRQLKYTQMDSVNSSIFYEYERMDSVTGKVYKWDNITGEFIADDLNITPGDTIQYSRFSPGSGRTILDSLTNNILLGQSVDTRYYSSTSSGDYYSRYLLSKNFGLSYSSSELELALTTINLKGAIIKGTVYGDTSLVVGIKDKNPELPQSFTLYQNYPNPFNPVTIIRFTVPEIKEGIRKTKLIIYDLLGKEIAVLLNDIKQPGGYKIEFDAAKYNLPSGIYFYRLITGVYDKTMKMIFIK
jgi:hypothetical protein